MNRTSGPGTSSPSGRAIAPARRSCTYSRSRSLAASLATFGRLARRSACHCAVVARYSSRRRGSTRCGAAPARSSTATGRCGGRSRAPRAAGPAGSRSPRARRTTGSGPTAGPSVIGGIPPASRNHLRPDRGRHAGLSGRVLARQPAAIASQNRTRPRAARSTAGPATASGHASHGSPARRLLDAHPHHLHLEVLRRPVESAQYTAWASRGAPRRRRSPPPWAPSATRSTTP